MPAACPAQLIVQRPWPSRDGEGVAPLLPGAGRLWLGGVFGLAGDRDSSGATLLWVFTGSDVLATRWQVLE